MKLIDRIHAKMQAIEHFPDGVTQVPGRIAGTAFFPGGDGLWKEVKAERDIPIGGVMVVGHNFDSVNGFKKSFAAGKEPLRCATWRNLLHFLNSANIDPNECFFTNVYLGLIDGASNVGKFPGARSLLFVDACLALLEEQICAQRPRIILTLGRYVPPLFAQLSPSLLSWRGTTSLSQLDAAGNGLIARAEFAGGLLNSHVVALTHPAQRHLNVARRHYRDASGDAAEIALVRAAEAAA